MSKGAKKVFLTPKEQELRVVRKPKAEKVSVPVSRMTATPVQVVEKIYRRALSAEEAEQVARQPFHNKGKNRKTKSTSRR